MKRKQRSAPPLHHREDALFYENIAASMVATAAEYRATERFDDRADGYEQAAHMYTKEARQHWKLHWAQTHCVEHEDCRASPELAVACKGRG